MWYRFVAAADAAAADEEAQDKGNIEPVKANCKVDRLLAECDQKTRRRLKRRRRLCQWSSKGAVEIVKKAAVPVETGRVVRVEESEAELVPESRQVGPIDNADGDSRDSDQLVIDTSPVPTPLPPATSPSPPPLIPLIPQSQPTTKTADWLPKTVFNLDDRHLLAQRLQRQTAVSETLPSRATVREEAEEKDDDNDDDGQVHDSIGALDLSGKSGDSNMSVSPIGADCMVIADAMATPVRTSSPKLRRPMSTSPICGKNSGPHPYFLAPIYCSSLAVQQQQLQKKKKKSVGGGDVKSTRDNFWELLAMAASTSASKAIKGFHSADL